MVEAKSGKTVVWDRIRQLSRSGREGVFIHWKSAVAFLALLVVFVVLMFALGSAGAISLDFIRIHWPDFFSPAWTGPAWNSLSLTCFSFGLGFLGALPLGVIRAFRPRWPRNKKRATLRHQEKAKGAARRSVRRAFLLPAYGLATGYVEGIRGTPFLVQMFLVFYLVLTVAPKLSQLYYLAALIALTLNTIGYQAEVLRAGFQSVETGQVEAAKSIGMRGRQIFFHITLPQSLRLITLPLTNEWISLFKASSIVSIISIRELTLQAEDLGVGVGGGKPIEAFLMVALIYVAIILPVSRAITYIERKRRIPGLGASVAMPGRGRKRIRPRVEAAT